MAKRRSFGPFVLVFTALTCSMYVACGDDDYIIPPAAGAGGTGNDAGGGSGGTAGTAGSAGSAGDGGTGGTEDGGTPPADAASDAALPDDAGDDAATSGT